MDPNIYRVFFRIYITLLATYTKDIHTAYPDLQSKLNIKFKYSYQQLGNDKMKSEDESPIHFCTRIQNNNSISNSCTLFDKSDTLSQADIVREQYALLPYPAVTREEIEGSRRHYNGNTRNVPYIIAPHNELDVVNHFLYKGRNGFMYVFSIILSYSFL